MSIKLMTKAWEMDIPTSPKMVLLALCDRCNDEGFCYPGQEVLSQKCSMSVRNIQRHLKWLEEHKCIARERRQHGRIRTSDNYQITLDSFIQEGDNLSGDNLSRDKIDIKNTTKSTYEGDNLSRCFKEEPSVIRQLEPSDIADGVTPAPQTEKSHSPEQPKKSDKDPRGNPANKICWGSYARAYRNRYGVLPLSNAQTRSQTALLVKSVGKDIAPALAAYYVSHNDSFFVRERHPIGLLLKNYQRVLTDMQRNEQMTQAKAKQTENTQSNFEAAKGALAILKAKGVA